MLQIICPSCKKSVVLHAPRAASMDLEKDTVVFPEGVSCPECEGDIPAGVVVSLDFGSESVQIITSVGNLTL